MSFLAIVRHGLSQANIDGIIAGHFDSPLTEVGLTQAEETAKLLADIPFHQAHSSTLQRAEQTLKIILRELKLGITATTHNDLKERNWGLLDGQPHPYYGKEKSLYTEEQLAAWQTWAARPPKGESYNDVSKRVVSYFDLKVLPQLRSGKNILLVGHNGMLKTLQRHLENIPHEETHKLNLQNCEVKLYEFDESGAVKSVEKRSIHT